MQNFGEVNNGADCKNGHVEERDGSRGRRLFKYEQSF
jgi:hypothetical protein